MSTCAKCIYKPFCNSSGYVCSSFKDRDRFADRDEVIGEFAERLKEAHDQCDGKEDVPWLIDKIAKEMTEKHDRE